MKVTQTYIRAGLAVVSLILIIVSLWVIVSNDQSAHRDSAASSPALPIDTLLSASDVRSALIEAVKNDDAALLRTWQQQLLSAARQIGYTDEQLGFLRGQRGQDYLHFRGARFAFSDDVELAYQRGGPLESIVQRYPQARDLVDDAQKLFTARDQILAQVADELLQEALAQEGAESVSSAERLALEGAAQREALRLWQARWRK
ncbi:hypothetical protein [Alteromonas oceanisediminis]|uniref:hypothetical protein n=1 Tax=Alteromonas oceanisediminis TaxID=2836180 RepID=UPI001BD995CA|nr:hypothetical protein [Alteromonas oceanisediminis]MBT0587271.1 hypothetical protein [Alteromonas oceanisediminis]